MARLAILASGSGTNFQAIAERLAADGRHEAACLVCDKPGAYALERAGLLGIPAFLVPYKGRSREDAEAAIAERLAEARADFVALAGFMRILSPRIVGAWKGRMVNIHPALLPRHPGAHAIEESFGSGDPELGITIHFVDEGMDTGEVILQKSFRRTPGMDLAAAEAAIHGLEHRWYPEIISGLLDRLGGRNPESAKE